MAQQVQPRQKEKQILSEGWQPISIWLNNVQLLEESPLGLIRNDGDFASGLLLINASPSTPTKDAYQMKNAKKSSIIYQATKRVFHLQNAAGEKIDIIFQLRNDGMAFRYFFPDRSSDLKPITKEITAYNFNIEARGWLQPMSVAKSGWERSNPSYEEGYKQNIPVGTPSNAGWVYPALFKTNERWILITESSLDSSFCGTRLINDSASSLYHLGSQIREKFLLAEDFFLNPLFPGIHPGGL
jgi:hypothetical protein